MKFTRDWLFDHLQTDRTLNEILDALPMLGLEVESVVDRAEALVTRCRWSAGRQTHGLV